MDTTLVTVTVLSMGMAAALSAIVWRLLREERQRSDARVVALQAAARTPPAVRAQPAAAPVLAARKEARGNPADLPLRSAPAAASLPAAITAGALFAERRQPSPWGNRLGVMAALALVGAAALLIALTAARVQTTTGGPVSGAAPASVDAELELVSLRDSRQDGTLTITGLVHNPRAASPLSRVTVTAYTFDDRGAFLASGRAPLDMTALAPGDDSPFVVTVPATGTVARYRIGFRGEDGRVIGHVDRRQQGPVAALVPNAKDTHW